jgi:hypothetical protein
MSSVMHWDITAIYAERTTLASRILCRTNIPAQITRNPQNITKKTEQMSLIKETGYP